MKWLLTLIDRLFALIGAMLFCQIPLFIQQYIQQLAGHEAELHLQVNLIQRTAKLTGKTLEQYVQKFLSASDADFLHQGELMQSMIARWHHLSVSLNALQESTVLTRPFIFIKTFDMEIIKSTFHHFQIGVPLNFEGAFYAFAGMILGYLTFLMLRKLGRRKITTESTENTAGLRRPFKG